MFGGSSVLFQVEDNRILPNNVKPDIGNKDTDDKQST